MYNIANMPYNEVIVTKNYGKLYIEMDGKWIAREYDPSKNKAWKMKSLYETDSAVDMARWLNDVAN